MQPNSNFDNPDIANFLKHHHVAVLGTANKQTAMPHAAAVYYATDSKMNIFFVTKEGTVKSKNLDSNPQAAIAIYERENQRTLQTSGPVSRVDDPVMMEKALRIMAKYSKETADTEVTPISKIQAGDYVLYKLSPQSYRLADYKYGVRNYIFDTATAPGESLDY